MVTEPEIKFVLFGTVALLTGLTAAVLLASNPRRNWNQWLAFFLLLVCGNYAMQVADAYDATMAGREEVTEAQHARFSGLAGSIAFVFLILDPAVLVYFTSIYPRRTGLADRPALTAALGALVATFLAVEVATRGLSAPGHVFAPWRLTFFAYLVGCYLYAAARMTRSYLGEPSSVMSTQLRVVTLGLLVVTLPRVALVPDEVLGTLFVAIGYPDVPASVHHLSSMVARVTVLAVLLVALHRWVSRLPAEGERRAEARAMARTVGVVFAGFAALWVTSRVLGFLTYPQGPAASPEAVLVRNVTELSAFAARWFVFVAAMFYGVVRYQVLTADLGSRQGAVVAVAVAACFLVVGSGGSAFGPWAGALVAAALLGIVGFLVAARPESTASAYLHERRLEVYRAQLAAALAAGPLGPDATRTLEDARDRLGVSAREHQTLLAIAQAEEAGPGAHAVMLGRYEVLRRLGAGGYATVFLARDRERGGLVVLKRIRHDLVGSREALEAALRELEVARRVSHANVVGIHDVVRMDDGAVVVMEYAEGGSLRDLLAERRVLPAPEAGELLRQVLAGLEALHEAGVLHGDLKPENILLDARGRVKLADFGAARAVLPSHTLVHATAAGGAAGTLLYLAPEVARGQRATARSDLYAAGAVAHELVTGSAHVDSNGGPYEVLARIVQGAKPPADGLPEGWSAFLARSLAAEPSARFASAGAMRDAVPDARPAAAATTRLPRWKGWRTEV